MGMRPLARWSPAEVPGSGWRKVSSAKWRTTAPEQDKPILAAEGAGRASGQPSASYHLRCGERGHAVPGSPTCLARVRERAAGPATATTSAAATTTSAT